MPDIQEAKCYEFTVRIFPPLGAPRGGAKKILPPLHLFLYTPLQSINRIPLEVKKNSSPLA